jgi:hypothetical protein
MSTRKAVLVPGASGGSASDYERFVFNLATLNVLALGTNATPRITAERQVRLLRWRVAVNEVPTGSSSIFDIRKVTGGSIFLSGNANKIICPAATARNKGTTFATSNYILNYEDELVVDVLQIGSTFPGFRYVIQLVGVIV